METTVTAPAAPAVPAAITHADVAAIVAKALEPLVVQLKAKATDNMGDRPVITERDVKQATEGTGLSAIRIAKAIAVVALSRAAGDEKTIPGVLKGWGYEFEAKAFEAERQKAFTSGLLTDGGSLVPQNFASEVIELLRKKTVIRRAGYRQVPLANDNLSIGRQSSASSASYDGEGVAITPSKPGTDMVQLSAKKLRSLVVISNDLIRNASISAEEFVRADMLAVMALREDLAFIRGDGTSNTPRGLRFETAAGNVFAQTAASPKAPTIAEVATELNKLFFKLETNDVDAVGPRLIISPRTKFYLASLRDGLNNPVYEAEIGRGTLRGVPFFTTNQIPENLGGTTDESEIYYYETDCLMIGDAMSMELTVVPNGTYEESGSTKSGLSRDETVMRVISKHDSRLRHNVAAAVVTGVRWGAP